jgi:glycosyltransferase involved in cell wall biosynthesis
MAVILNVVKDLNNILIISLVNENILKQPTYNSSMNNHPNILVVSTSDASGGAARAAFRIHKAVQAQGMDSRMLVKNRITTDSSILPVSDFTPTNSAYRTYDWVRNKIKNKIQHYRWNQYPDREDVFMSDLRGSRLHGALQKIEYDILHLHWINLRFVDIEDLAKVTKPIVWTLHDCWPFTGVCHYFYDCTRYKQSCGCCPHLASNNKKDLSHKVWKKKMEIFSKLNIHVVCPSNWLAQAARESAIFKQFPVSVIPNPLDTNFFTPGSKVDACKVLSISPDKRYILYGAMNAIKDRRKGFAELKSCLQYYEKQFDTKDIEVLIFGSDEKAPLELNHIRTTDLGLLNDQQLRAAYRASDVMVTPSLSENLSNIIMESLSCGTPVVGFDIGGNSDLIEHKRNGYLAESYNPQDLATGIAWCLDNNTSGELSRNARKKVEENYSMERVGEKYTDLYRKLIK